MTSTRIGFASLTIALAIVATAGAQGYQSINLVSDGSVPALHTDPNLVNAWGLVFNPNGFSWVNDNETGLSTLYDGMGNPQSLVVQVPGAAGPANPTGIVFNGVANNFVVNDGAGGHSGTSAFIFASEDGTISGWSPAVPPPAPSTHAQLAVDNSAAGAVYKGLALGTSSGAQFIYATDFHNNRIDMFSSTFAPVVPAGSFTDPNIPAGFAPFGIQNLGGNLYVTYAKQDGDAHDDVAGLGNGFVDVFDTQGHLLHHLVAQGALNSPWGMAIAPAGFGALTGDLLVGNFGDGMIHAYDSTSGAPLGTLSDKSGNPLVFEGLWALQPGNGLFGQYADSIFFTAGPGDESHGLYGRISAVPEPSTVVMALLGACCLAAWRRRG